MEQKDFGLVFAGGGGKGAYEIGVWKALRLLRMDGWIKAVSGASVGALNAALFAWNDYDRAEEIWRSIRPIQFLDAGTDSFCSREGIQEILHKHISLTELSNSPLRAYVSVACCPESTEAVMKADAALACAVPGREWEGEYRLLNGQSPEMIERLLLASSALPLVYEPVRIGDAFYRDGGLFDNLPMRPLLESGLRNLILVLLSQTAEYDIHLASQAEELLVIRPSADIGKLVTGTLDFDSENVMYRVHLGFYDTLRTVEFYERRAIGFPVSPKEKAERIAADLEKVGSLTNVARLSGSVRRNKDKFEEIAERYR